MQNKPTGSILEQDIHRLSLKLTGCLDFASTSLHNAFQFWRLSCSKTLRLGSIFLLYFFLCFSLFFWSFYLFVISLLLPLHPRAAHVSQLVSPPSLTVAWLVYRWSSQEKLIMPTNEISLLPTPYTQTQPGTVRWRKARQREKERIAFVV